MAPVTKVSARHAIEQLPEVSTGCADLGNSYAGYNPQMGVVWTYISMPDGTNVEYRGVPGKMTRKISNQTAEQALGRSIGDSFIDAGSSILPTRLWDAPSAIAYRGGSKCVGMLRGPCDKDDYCKYAEGQQRQYCRKKKNTPRKSAPKNAAPRKSAPRKSAPRKSAPRKSAPRKRTYDDACGADGSSSKRPKTAPKHSAQKKSPQTKSAQKKRAYDDACGADGSSRKRSKAALQAPKKSAPKQLSRWNIAVKKAARELKVPFQVAPKKNSKLYHAAHMHYKNLHTHCYID